MAKDLSKLHDFELVSLAVEGEESSFAEIVKRHQNIVATTAMGMLSDMEESTEIGQQVFIRFYKSMGQFRKEAKLSTYLSRITINLCLNRLKRNQNFRTRSLNLDLAQSQAQPDFSKSLEDKDVVNKALQYLEEHYRSVVVLRMIKGYNTQEASEILGIPKGTTLSRLKRGMDKLKIILIENFNYE